MSTDLHAVQNYDADPDTVFGKFSDRAFLEGRLQAAGGIDPEITELTVGDDGAVKIATKQAIPASAMPSMVATLMPGDPVILRTENWRAAADTVGGYIADFDVVIKNAPATLKGTMTLAPAGAGKSTLTVDGQASVPIPLFGSKIEGVIIEQVGKLLEAEETYTRRVLAG